MTKLTYEYMGQIETKEVITNDKIKAVDILKSEFAHNPKELKIISVENSEDVEEQNIYNTIEKRRVSEIEDVKKLILKTLNAQYKKPYGKSNKKVSKKIEFKSINKDIIQNYVNEITTNGLYKNAITVNISYAIFIEPTEEYYLSAE